MILERLSMLLERQAEMRGKIVTTLAYPIVLAVVAMGVVTALMMFVVPQVVEQFDTVGQQLPLLTRIVIGISDFLVGYWWALLLFVALVGVGCVAGACGTRDPARVRQLDAAHCRLLGRLLRDLHAARMARTLATMVASRLPLLEGLTLTGGHDPQPARCALASDEIVESIRGGGSLSAAMRRSGVFPPLLVYLAAIGRGGGPARRDARTRRRLSGARIRPLHRDRAVAARTAIIVVMGGIVALDRAIDPAADPAAQHACRPMRFT